MALRDQLKIEAEENKKMKLDVQRSLAEREVLEKNIKTKHLFLRTWVGYFLSLFLKDRGTIPTNIGTSLHVLSNMYITKDYLSSMIEICEFGGYVPMFVVGHLKNSLRRMGNNAKLPWSIITAPYHINAKDGLDERIRAWEHTVDPKAKFTRTERERASRQLYTVDLYKQGKTLMKAKVVLHVHASKASELDAALNIIYAELTKMGITYELKTYKMMNALKECAIMSTQMQKSGMTILTNAHIAQFVPNFGGENDKKGVFFGINKLANVPYRIDFSSISIARNVYVVAPSGVGKTVITVNAIQSALEKGNYRLIIMDIKGNEYKVLVESIGGRVVSLRVNSRGYINSWALYAEDVDATNPIMVENYFKDRLQFTKEQMVILSGLKDGNALLNLKSLLDEFINDYYMFLGITMDNVKSWKASEKLTPFDMWEAFEKYYPAKLSKYHIDNSTLVTLRMYFTREGTKSYVFTESMDYNRIIDSPAISFDFGLLSSGGESSSDIDMDILRLKFVYMQRINRDYTSNNYAHDLRTLKVLEESQIVSDEIMHIYAKEYTLGRSQKQDTILIGNSVAALENSITASPLISNTTCLLVSKLTDKPLDFLIKQFNLEQYRPLLTLAGSEAQYDNCFAVINNMQAHAMPGLVRVEMPKQENGRPVEYKVNNPSKEGLYGR